MQGSGAGQCANEVELRHPDRGESQRERDFCVAPRGLFEFRDGRVVRMGDGLCEKRQELIGRLLERDVFESTLNLGPFVSRRHAQTSGVVFKGLVENGQEVQAWRRELCSSLCELLQKMNITLIRNPRREFKEFSKLVNNQYNPVRSSGLLKAQSHIGDSLDEFARGNDSILRRASVKALQSVKGLGGSAALVEFVEIAAARTQNRDRKRLVRAADQYRAEARGSEGSLPSSIKEILKESLVLLLQDALRQLPGWALG